jgi:hypothetical protein
LLLALLLLLLLLLLQANRHVRETRQNGRSSRSHALIRLTVCSWDHTSSAAMLPLTPVTVACITFADLAGSEGLARTGSDGAQLAEGKAINQSLLALGKVMRGLAANKQGGWVGDRVAVCMVLAYTCSLQEGQMAVGYTICITPRQPAMPGPESA